MTILEAIDSRKSVRSYTDTAINTEKIQILSKNIEDFNRSAELNIEFIVNGHAAFSSMRKTYGLFKNVQSIIVLKGKTADEFLLEKSGYYGEQLVLQAAMLDLGTCWVGGTFDKDQIKIAKDETIAAVITIGNAAEKKSFMEKVIKTVATGKRKPTEHFYTADTSAPEWFLAGVEAVRKAPTAVNSQKVHLTYDKENVTISVPETYRLDLMDLGIAKAHFEITVGGKFPQGNHAIFEKQV